MKIRLVEDWRKAHKWLSTQLLAGASAVALAYDYLPSVREYVAPYVSPKTMACLAAVILIARILDQGGKKP